MTSIDIRHGDCLTVLRDMPDNSVDSVTTDPPYGLSNTKPAQVADVLAAWVTGDTEAVPAKKGGFMGKDWDSFVPPPAVWAECLRVLKPGGHMAVFAGARTQDLMGLSIRLAGFEIRDTLGWVYGSGFPKSQNIGKAIDKRGGVPHIAVEVGAAIRDARIARGLSKSWCDKHFCGGSTNWTWFEGRPSGIRPPTDEDFQRIVNEWPELAPYAEKVAEVDREVVGKNKWTNSANHFVPGEDHTERVHTDITAPATSEAKQWDGWGTALKPAIEPIILARKPLDGTVAANVLAHGVGGLNIDASRVGTDEDRSRPPRTPNAMYGGGKGTNLTASESNPAGRFPANVLLDEHAAKEMDEQSGWQKDGTAVNRNRGDDEKRSIYGGGWRKRGEDQTHGGEGGASRFFPVFKYQAKAPKKERPVIYLNECECDEWQSPEKATTESASTGGRSWNTSTSGSGSTGQSPTDTTSITSTMTSSTIGSKTYDASPELSTNASIQDVNFETESGGNRAECADHSNPSVTGTGTSVKKAGPSTVGAAPAISRKWFTTSECESCGAPRRKVTHCTVKPVALMEWLVTLITPEGGTTLDPFAGTGTTLQAARDAGFNAVGVEQDEDYLALIEQRLGA